MIYEYECRNCERVCDIIKPASQFERTESCEFCGRDMVRIFKPKIHLHNTRVHNPYYSIALGDVVKNPKEELQKAKDKGWEPIGNENPAKHIKFTPKSYDD